jgi:hypothetical protein
MCPKNSAVNGLVTPHFLHVLVSMKLTPMNLLQSVYPYSPLCQKKRLRYPFSTLNSFSLLISFNPCFLIMSRMVSMMAVCVPFNS